MGKGPTLKRHSSRLPIFLDNLRSDETMAAIQDVHVSIAPQQVIQLRVSQL